MVRVKHAKVMTEQANVRSDQARVGVDQAKTSVEERKQQNQSQVKLLDETLGFMRETRQHKQKVASGPTRQLSDELKG